jgi:DNA invertase Pin-like site-specific DNA recombinase
MAHKGKRTTAVAYVRTSSAANVGPEKDSERRQRHAIAGYARRAGYAVADTFTDAAVRGGDTIERRPGFSALLDCIEGNGVHVVLVEDASRLARSVLVQELAIVSLKARGVRVLAANGDDLTETDDEMRTAMRQMATVFAQLEKARLVKKLRAARERQRERTGKSEGRKSHAELRPDMVALARRLRRKRPKRGQRSLRDIAAELERHGFRNERGVRFSAASVQNMLAQRS